MLRPSALGFSPHLPVSVYGTGSCNTIAAFLDNKLTGFTTILRSPLRLWIVRRICLSYSSSAWTGLLIPGSRFLVVSPQFCPSTTPLGLALGPDLPRADQLYPGNLGYSAGRILTSLSLLIPAFSLLNRPRPLPMTLLPVKIAPLPMNYVHP